MPFFGERIVADMRAALRHNDGIRYVPSHSKKGVILAAESGFVALLAGEGGFFAQRDGHIVCVSSVFIGVQAGGAS